MWICSQQLLCLHLNPSLRAKCRGLLRVYHLTYSSWLRQSKCQNSKRQFTSLIAPIISSLINNSFSLSSFPLPWKKAEIVLILKSGDSEEPANTRPISLLPILFKVCERAAHLQFVNFLDSSNIIHQMQSGNRKFHATQCALLHFTDELFNDTDQKKMSVVGLLDMICPKLLTAFDMILCRANFAKLVCRNLRVPGLKAICYNVNKSFRFRIPCPAPYP